MYQRVTNDAINITTEETFIYKNENQDQRKKKTRQFEGSG